MLNEKKNVYVFLIKTAPLYAGLGSKQKTFSICHATYTNVLFEFPLAVLKRALLK